MTPFNHTKLLQAEQHHYRTTYPSVPGHCLAHTQYKDNSTNGLTKCIIDYIRFTGGFAERINRMGYQIKTKANKQVWVSGSGTNGTSDISAVIAGRAVRIEVKFGRDRIRPDQVRYAEKVTRAGALYFIARDFDSFVEWYESVTVPALVDKITNF